ncbi:MAG: 16S rRNA (adenine(1518)-N(6)/adenine(1519)-N(6))-dimethyltransferase RsmA [Actinomycetes bacterium]|nr:16S rRNA (adenine(1518)-N(6)/adenine(1519)-N(6))-dimethyltransferase RsmA [Actinomycetes bacterium]
MNSPLASPSATIALLRHYGLATKKRLGQHFLIDDAIVGKILRLADPAPDDVILEIGPGIGTLTLALLATRSTSSALIAIEKDPALVTVLNETLSEYVHSGALTILEADALNLQPELLPTAPTSLIANLPYQVAATVTLDAFQRLTTLQSATVMVQHEVACRMAANPGTKDYGAYTVKLRLLARPAGNFAVSRRSFLPPPRVDSRVIRLQRQPVMDALTYEKVTSLVDRAFASRRKTMRNNLRAVWDEAQVEVALAQAGIEASVRAEILKPEDFIHLSELL